MGRGIVFSLSLPSILVPIKDLLTKQASKLLACKKQTANKQQNNFLNEAAQRECARPVVAEGGVDTPRHSLQRCRSKALKDGGIRKLTSFEIPDLKVLKGF